MLGTHICFMCSFILSYNTFSGSVIIFSDEEPEAQRNVSVQNLETKI